MVLSIRMRIIYNIKHRYAICLKFGDKFLTFLTKLVPEKESQYIYIFYIYIILYIFLFIYIYTIEYI